MKTYKFTATGNVEITAYGLLQIDGTTIIDKILEELGIDEDSFSKEFAGKVEITITDLTEQEEGSENE